MKLYCKLHICTHTDIWYYYGNFTLSGEWSPCEFIHDVTRDAVFVELEYRNEMTKCSARLLILSCAHQLVKLA